MEIEKCYSGAIFLIEDYQKTSKDFKSFKEKLHEYKIINSSDKFNDLSTIRNDLLNKFNAR
jgi:hypothetical protein